MNDEKRTVPADASPSVERQGEDLSVYCPTCGARLQDSNCRLKCATCGFFLSCSDFY